MPNGEGGGGFFFNIFAFFQSLLDSFINFVLKVFDFVFRLFGFQFSYDVVQENWLGKVWKGFTKGLKHVLSDIIHLRFVHLWLDYLRLIARLRAWYEKHFKWLIDLRKRYDEWFRTTIVPILNLLQRIRRVLAIFRIFHLKFAEKLDALIGRLESKIIRNVLVLRQKVNEISTIINLILDPSLVIRNVPLLRSIWTALDDIVRIFFHTTLRRIFGPVGGAVVKPRTGLLSNEDVRALRRAGFDTTTAYGQAGAEGYELYKAVLKEGR